MNAGHADTVLRACGETLRRIHAVPTGFLHTDTGADPAPDKAPVHGDFGPHNLLLDPSTLQVTAVVDWEFAHPGDPVEDLAWCEWIVRMHHPDHRKSLHHFFDAYDGPVPSWPARRAAMLARCTWFREFCHRWEPNGPGVRRWEERFRITAAWQEEPAERVR
ncbi:phosphotransferase family protein [Streptomyces sp. NPDC050509]|uniref:phosphotransferase family protein n=1 Tax=Streptomyces sp. NPDC050509 TaxID=3365620 RepID=UPI0037B4CA26